jgi:predicted SAM-dependent methyltransferase
MNFGCGPDIKDGWTNVDIVARPGVFIWNGMSFANISGRRVQPQLWDYDFILVNHVLCTMKPHDVRDVLRGLFETLKVGGKIQIIDMDLLKVFKAYQEGRADDVPIEEGDIDDRLCFAISGYGTRLSLYTPERMNNVLKDAGFGLIENIESSKYDTRPKESLVFEAYRCV